MMRHLLLAAALVAAAALPAAPAADAADGYVTPAPFMTLFKQFPRSQGPDTIGRQLAEAMEKAGTLAADGPLVLVTGDGVFAYDGSSGELIASADFREAANSGFFELTSLSHVGPAISYMAKMKELGDSRWRDRLDDLLAALRAVQQLNRQGDGAWLDALAQPAWAPFRDRIAAMVDYGTWMAGSYLQGVKDSDGAGFTLAGVESDLLAVRNDRYPIPFNNVMVGTFALVGLEGAYTVHAALADAEIDWPAAMVVVHMGVGTNFGAGLTVGTNAMVGLLRQISGYELPEDRVFITPYAELRDSVGSPALAAADLDYYKASVWYSLYSRSVIAEEVFRGITSIYQPPRPALPGDYAVTAPDQIEPFLMRLKFALSNPTELLSSTVSFWMGPALFHAGWDPAATPVPGLTTGFPEGIDGYPAGNPDF